jgi:hypothetical protein
MCRQTIKLVFQMLDAGVESADPDGYPDEGDDENEQQKVFHDGCEEYSIERRWGVGGTLVASPHRYANAGVSAPQRTKNVRRGPRSPLRVTVKLSRFGRDDGR